MIGEICEEQDSPLSDNHRHSEGSYDHKQRRAISQPVRSLERKPACAPRQKRQQKRPEGKMHGVRIEGEYGRLVIAYISHQENPSEKK